MPRFLDLFAGAGGLSEGFIQAGYSPVAHVEMDVAACYTLKTRAAFHWLKANENIELYNQYLRGEMTRNEFYSHIPQTVLDHHIESIASAIGKATNISTKGRTTPYIPSETPKEKLSQLLEYCRTMKMSYSYKPVLIMALLHSSKNGSIPIENAAKYFRDFYASRREQGLTAEKKRCIYLRDDVTDKQIIANLVSNPIKALCESGFFFFNEKEQIFSLSPEIWPFLDKGNKAAITKICKQRLKEYYSE